MSDYKLIDVSNCPYTVNFEDYYFGFKTLVRDDLDFIESKSRIKRELVLKDYDKYFYFRGIYVKYRYYRRDQMFVHGTFNMYKRFEDIDEFTKDLI